MFSCLKHWWSNLFASFELFLKVLNVSSVNGQGKWNDRCDLFYELSPKVIHSWTVLEHGLFTNVFTHATDCSVQPSNFRISPGDTSSRFSLTLRKQKWKLQSAWINKKMLGMKITWSLWERLLVLTMNL